MVTRVVSRFVLIATTAVLLSACTQAGSTAPASTEAGLVPRTTASPGNTWERLVAEAQKEGTVVIYAGALGDAQAALISAFKEKYGISLHIASGRGEEMAVKIDRERRAGVYAVDVGLIGRNTYTNVIKPFGVTVPLEPLLVLPEVRDPSRWREGKLPMGDREGHVAILLVGAMPVALANADMVGRRDIKAYADLLDPRWRGKLAINDPTIIGEAARWFTLVLTGVMGPDKGIAFMKELVKQEIAITRDRRLLVEWAARGKYAVALWPERSSALNFVRAGAPVFFPDMEGQRLNAPAATNVMVFDRAPHPQAARLFVNWLMSQEGVTLISRNLGVGSVRLDVATDFLEPAFVLRPDEQILGDDFDLAVEQNVKLAVEIFGQATGR